MAVTAGRTWNASSSTTSATAVVAFASTRGKAIYAPTAADNGSNFKAVNFDVASSSAAPLLVNIPAIHGGTTYYYTIPIGTSKEFICVSDGDSHTPMGDFIQVKSDGANVATFSGGITA